MTVYSADGAGMLLQALELLARDLLRLLGHAGGLDLLVELRDVLAVVELAELLLDRLELLAQHRLALVARKLLAHLGVDLLLDLEDLHAVLQRTRAPWRARLGTSSSPSSAMRSSVDCSRLAAAMSASRDGSRMASRICAVSSGMSGDSAITCLAASRTAIASPSASGDSRVDLLDRMDVGDEVGRDLREDAEAPPLAARE